MLWGGEIFRGGTVVKVVVGVVVVALGVVESGLLSTLGVGPVSVPVVSVIGCGLSSLLTPHPASTKHSRTPTSRFTGAPPATERRTGPRRRAVR